MSDSKAARELELDPRLERLFSHARTLYTIWCSACKRNYRADKWRYNAAEDTHTCPKEGCLNKEG